MPEAFWYVVLGFASSLLLLVLKELFSMRKVPANGPSKAGDLPPKHWEDRFDRLESIMEQQTSIMGKQITLMSAIDKTIAVQTEILKQVREGLK